MSSSKEDGRKPLSIRLLDILLINSSSESRAAFLRRILRFVERVRLQIHESRLCKMILQGLQPDNLSAVRKFRGGIELHRLRSGIGKSFYLSQYVELFKSNPPRVDLIVAPCTGSCLPVKFNLLFQSKVFCLRVFKGRGTGRRWRGGSAKSRFFNQTHGISDWTPFRRYQSNSPYPGEGLLQDEFHRLIRRVGNVHRRHFRCRSDWQACGLTRRSRIG